MNGYNVICFDSTGVEYIPREIKQIIGKKMSQQIFIE